MIYFRSITYVIIIPSTLLMTHQSEKNETLTEEKLKEYLKAFSNPFLPQLKLILEFDRNYGVRDILQLNTCPTYLNFDDSKNPIYLIKTFMKNIETNGFLLGSCKVEIIETFWLQDGKLYSRCCEVHHNHNRFVQIKIEVDNSGPVNIIERVQKRDIPIVSLLHRFGYENLEACF